MKKLYTLLVFLVLGLGVNAQVWTHFTFEDSYADTIWRPFEDGSDTTIRTLTVVDNPGAWAPNESDSVLQFIVQDDAKLWVGMYTDQVEEMFFSETDHSVSMMVYKSMISEMRMKFELSTTGAEDVSVKMSNTLTDEWELITFDVPDAIGHWFSRLTIFPDFPEAREEGSTIYIDNIGTTEDNTAVFEQETGLELKLYPNPVRNMLSVQYNGMTGITVLDLQGKTLKSFTFQLTDSKIIGLADLVSGAYIVSVETAKGSYSGTFIKE